MATKQIWKIGGKSYNKEQLLALRSKVAEKSSESPEIGDPAGNKDVPEMKFLELKAHARSKGMEVKPKTNKAEILEYLKTI